jgi:phosphoribosyl 1,2-cyclic phosphodiesterase
MKVTLWGCRGSIPAPGMETHRYGGETACVEVEADGHVLVLDAGSGARKLGAKLAGRVERLDLFLTHLHMDHILGLGFCAPARLPGVEMHIWGPASATLTLQQRLNRYLSPPLFPVYLRDMSSVVQLHEVPHGDIEIGPFSVSSDFVCHPDPTVGYRVQCGESVLTYLPDHEPWLGVQDEPPRRDWLSGSDLAQGSDLLIHDAQYTLEEYAARVGWGHSAIAHALGFAASVEARQMILFHHDPAHSDALLDELTAEAGAAAGEGLEVYAGREGMSLELP